MAANPYKLVQNETATPLDLWDRGYRRCVVLLQSAKKAIIQGEPSSRIAKAKHLNDAFAIVEFWNAALPPSPSADVITPGLAPRLRKSYEFIMYRMVSANGSNAIADIDEAMVMLQHLHAVFHQKIQAVA